MNKNFYNLYENYCCLDLLRAKESGFVDEVVSGIFFPNNNKSSCKEGIPRIKYCPFCGAKIVTIKTETSWDWKTKKR
jgi:hypothetical protein